MSDKESQTPSGQELCKLAEKLINEQSTMTLATAKENMAWAAPVYYVYLRSCFYFFSDPTSRHIVESLASDQASAAIYPTASTWQEIRGIQMSGRIEVVRASLVVAEAIMAYLRKFPFTKDFFETGEDMDFTAFVKRFKVKLYRFNPDLVYYLDNGIRFGFREEVILKET
ncbi:MAG: pyridoxamine 5'-phosphate oxidase family protein [Pseudomonadota bacterium]